MPIGSGNYTVGSGGDYPDWGPALLDIIGNSGTYVSGDIKLTQISDCTVTYAASINPGYRSNGFKLTLTSNKNHYGNPNGGWKTYWDQAGYVDFQRFGNHEISYLNVDVGKFSSFRLFIGYGLAESLHHDTTSVFRNNIINCNNKSTFNGVAYNNNYKNNINMYNFNNKIFNTYYTKTAILLAFSNGILTNNNHIENNVIYGSGVGVGNNGDPTITFKNNAIHSNIGYCFEWGANQSSYNNLSSDASADDATTQSGNIINAVFSDEFVSLDSSSSDFLKPKYGGNAYNMGIAPSIPGNTSGIGGNPRPWS